MGARLLLSLPIFFSRTPLFHSPPPPTLFGEKGDSPDPVCFGGCCFLPSTVYGESGCWPPSQIVLCLPPILVVGRLGGCAHFSLLFIHPSPTRTTERTAPFLPWLLRRWGRIGRKPPSQRICAFMCRSLRGKSARPFLPFYSSFFHFYSAIP
jgi:hypothetical protein